MFSPNSLPDILDRIDNWSQEELESHINEVLPVLTISLKEVEQKSLSLRSVHILLHRCLLCVPVSDMDLKVLQHALPAAKDIFKEALEGIIIVLQDAEHLSDEEVDLSLKSLHHVCFVLLDEMKHVVQTISSFCPLSGNIVPSVPCTTLQLLRMIFAHCRDSEELYGSMQEYLVALFNNTKLLLSLLLPLLQTRLQFHLNSVDDEILLQNVFDSLANVGKSTTLLGVSVQTSVWTAYVNLVERYKTKKDLWNSIDISSPVIVIATSVSDMLHEMFEIHWFDFTLAIKGLIVLSSLVRVVTKLCFIFSGYLSDTCMPSLFRLLKLQLRSCAIDTNAVETQSLLHKEAEKRVGVAAASLISSLINDRSFFKMYFSNHQNSEVEESMGKLLVAIYICRSLVSSDLETRIMWIRDPNEHILASVFSILDFCHSGFCGNLKFQVASRMGKPTRTMDLYEYALSSVGAFILLIPPEYFNILEILLVKNIMEPKNWKGLFALDLWCILARQSSVSVRFSHITFILDLICNHQYIMCSPIKIHLRILLSRLWPLLPSHHQKMLIEKYPPMGMPEVWESVHIQPFSCDISKHIFLDTTRAIETFCAEPCIEVFKEMVKKIKCVVLFVSYEELSNIEESKYLFNNLSSSLLTLWFLFSKSLLKYSSEGWLSCFFYSVCDLTEKVCFTLTNSQLSEILQKLLDIVSSDETLHFKLKILCILRTLAEKTIDFNPQQQIVFQAIVNIFLATLQDTNVIVRQEALTVFEYFAHVTKHEEIIKLCLKRSKKGKEMVSLYLKKTPALVENNMESSIFVDFIKLQNNIHFTHTCSTKRNKIISKMYCSLEESFNDAPVVKKHVVKDDTYDPGISIIIQRLQADASLISNVCRTSNMSKATKSELLVEINKVKTCICEVSLSLSDSHV